VVAHIGYIEAHAVGSPAIQRVDDSRAAFKIFVQEGYRHAAKPPPPITPDALSAIIFEIGYHYARKRQLELLPRLTSRAVYLILAPFLSPEWANEFVDAKLNEMRLAPTPAEEIRQATQTGRLPNGQIEVSETPAAVTADV
jgi:hypothetical protein